MNGQRKTQRSIMLCTTTKLPTSSKRMIRTWTFLILMLTSVKGFFENIGAPGEDTTLQTVGSTNPVSVTRGIAGTATPFNFQSNRWGPDFTYSFYSFVPDRTYQINLGFAEIYGGACREGARIFNVTVNGQIKKNNLDVFKSAGGCDAALVETIYSEASSSGKFDIRFRGTTQNALSRILRFWIRPSLPHERG